MSRGKRFKGRSYRAQRSPRRSDDSNKLSPTDRKLIYWGRRQKQREGENGIFLEGTKLIREAIAAKFPLEAVWVTYECEEEYPELVTELRERRVSLQMVNEKTMKTISEMETPPGIVGVGQEPSFEYHEPEDSISLIVALTMVQDPGNLGGVIRTADYFGVDELWLGPGSSDPYSPKCIRGSMGGTFRLPIRSLDNLSEHISSFKMAGTEVWAAQAHSKEGSLQMNSTGKRILLIGGESRGIPSEYAGLADKIVSMRGAGRSESLNLAVATGILIYNATAGRYTPETKQE